MEMSMNKIIALDIGNVCFKIDKDVWLDKLNISADNIVLRKELNLKKNELELGIIKEDEFLSKLNALTEKSFSKNEIITAYCSIIGNEIPGMNNLINDFVKSGFKIMFFSDTSSLHLNYVYSRLSFANLILGGVFSFEVGAFKPDIKMFNEFESRYGKPYIYLDDLEKNCIVAKKLGWETHCFTSSEKCSIELSLL
jgi:FMN phosphatase YigB (HAD superfamily)